MIHVCVPVLKRYDLLRNMLLSLTTGSLKPFAFYIIDNGQNAANINAAVEGIFPVPHVFVPARPMGLASAWNWFIAHVPQERLICNDDLLFARDSLERLASIPGDFVSGLPGSNACSCFLLRDSCVAKVGVFDESISPGYAYFEDCDYVERMIMHGIPISGTDVGLVHVGSATLGANTVDEWNEHHRKFSLAQENFRAKWGRLPNVPGPHWPKASESIRVEVV